jgi:hypothetical protein
MPYPEVAETVPGEKVLPYPEVAFVLIAKKLSRLHPGKLCLRSLLSSPGGLKYMHIGNPCHRLSFSMAIVELLHGDW